MITNMLENESRVYDAKLPTMLEKHDGDYVIIKGDAVCHFADSYESAVQWAYDNFGLDRFFIRKVAKGADVVHFTRDLPCRL